MGQARRSIICAGLTVLLMAFTTIAAAANTNEVLYSCACDGVDAKNKHCGNAAAGGNYGEVVDNIKKSRMISVLAPQRRGKEKTGWACAQKGVYTCRCVGLSMSKGYCGNGAPKAKYGESVDNVSSVDAIKKYHATRTGDRATGWDCNLKSN